MFGSKNTTSTKKIIYITPGEHKLDEEGRLKLKNGPIEKAIIRGKLPIGLQAHELTRKSNEYLAGLDKFLKIGDSPVVFRTTEQYNDAIIDSFLYLMERFRNFVTDTKEDIFKNLVSNPSNIDNINNSTKKGEIIIVGVTQEELKTILSTLDESGYNTNVKEVGYRKIDIESIKPHYIYITTIELDTKKANFYQSPGKVSK